MNVRLIIDHDTCIGYGECVAEASDAVELHDDGCARLKVAELDAERAARLCAVCPTGAITTEAA